jgi:hypothetical protein
MPFAPSKRATHLVLLFFPFTKTYATDAPAFKYADEVATSFLIELGISIISMDWLLIAVPD